MGERGGDPYLSDDRPCKRIPWNSESMFDKDSVTIEMDDSREKTFEKSEIALVRLAFDF